MRRRSDQGLVELMQRTAAARRDMLGWAGATAGLAGMGAIGLQPRPARAATTMTWMGWQGYETPIRTGSFLKDNDIDFQPTFISSNEEIITKLQAGGLGAPISSPCISATCH